MAWRALGETSQFRYLSAGASYSPADAYPGAGRFDNGTRRTLYVSSTAQGAVSEFYRRHPELLNMQDSVVLQLFEVTLEVVAQVLDVNDDDDATAEGIHPGRLVSSDPDPDDRYGQCRALADRVELAAGCGIRYPSAASTTRPANLVVFGRPTPTSYLVRNVAREAGVPYIEPTEVVTL